MKRYALLRLENGANKVLFDCHAPDKATAVQKFKNSIKGVTLDDDGYGTYHHVTFCVAEYFEPFHTLP